MLSSTSTPPRASASPNNKTWWSPLELKTILDDDAEEIHSLSNAVGALLRENTELRRELSILKTPSDVYYATFGPPSRSELTTTVSDADRRNVTGSTLDGEAVLHQLSLLRCGAKIRATESAIVQTGADAALYRHRCSALEEEKQAWQLREVELRTMLRQCEDVVAQKDSSLMEWQARQAADEALLKSEREASAAARAIANELEGIVMELRDQLRTEAERCSILAMDNSILSSAISAAQSSALRQMPLQQTVDSLQQELREVKAKLDKFRIRCVELEMKTERMGSTEVQSPSC
jgi:chromosome segregation ATPase